MAQTLRVISLVAFGAAAAVLGIRLVGSAPARTAVQPDLGARLARLEATLPRVERSFAGVGAQLGAAALAGAATAGPSDEGTPEGEAREKREAAEHAQKERLHYDRLDVAARSGGGGDFVTEMRSRVATAPRPMGPGTHAPLDVRNIECSATVCRAQVNLTDRSEILFAAHVLGTGMSGMSMRPLDGGDAVYYFGTPGHRLPRITF